MDRDSNPYSPPNNRGSQTRAESEAKARRGPLLYFVIAAIISVMLAIPLLVPRSLSVKDDPNPVGYLLILLSFPVGGFAYRLRSRKWPIDATVRQRQITACCGTLIIPFTAALLTGMRGQGLHTTVLCALMALILSIGILISGQRR